MSNNIMTVTLDSCYNTPAEAAAFTAHCKANYNIMADFHDGGDHYSSWTLTGRKDALRKVINDEWNPTATSEADLADIAALMYPKEFTELYGAEAAAKYLD